MFPSKKRNMDTWSLEKELQLVNSDLPDLLDLLALFDYKPQYQTISMMESQLPYLLGAMNRYITEPIALPSPLLCVKFQPIRVRELTGVCTPVKDIVSKELDCLQSMSSISTRAISYILSMLFSNEQLCDVLTLFPAFVRMVKNDFQLLRNEIDEWKDKYAKQAKLLSQANKKILNLENENYIAKVMTQLHEQNAHLQANNFNKELEILKMQDRINDMELINHFESNKSIESGAELFVQMAIQLKNKTQELHDMNNKYQQIIITQMKQIMKQERTILSVVYSCYIIAAENETLKSNYAKLNDDETDDDDCVLLS